MREPLHLQPRLDDENSHFLNAENSSFGLDAFAGTVGELIEEVAENLVVGWRNYAQAPDSELSPKALESKQVLLAAMDEVAIGR